MKSVTFKFWVTREISRRHCNLKPKRFDFCIKYKPIDRTFHFIINDWNYLAFWKKLACCVFKVFQDIIHTDDEHVVAVSVIQRK